MSESVIDGLHLDDNPVVSGTYSLTYRHKMLVKEMKRALPAEVRGKPGRGSEGVIVQKAIEFLAVNFDPKMFLDSDDALDVRKHPAFVSTGSTLVVSVDKPARARSLGAGSLSGVAGGRISAPLSQSDIPPNTAAQIFGGRGDDEDLFIRSEG